MQAQQLWLTGLILLGKWYLPRPESEPLSPALAGKFLTTGAPGEPSSALLAVFISEYLGGGYVSWPWKSGLL